MDGGREEVGVGVKRKEREWLVGWGRGGGEEGGKLGSEQPIISFH